MSTSSQGAKSGFLAAALAASLWGLGFFFGKIALRELSVPHMVLYRFLFAGIAAVPFLPRSDVRWTPPEWRSLLLGSFFGIPVQFLLQFYGLAHTTVAHAALMVGTMPVILAGGASLFLGERLDGLGWASLLGSCTGAALIALSRSSSTEGTATLFGDGLVVVSMALALIYIVTQRRLLDRHPPVAVSSYGLLAGLAMLAPIAIARAGLPSVHLSREAWIALAASGLLCTTATTLLWNWSIKRVPASQAGVFLNLEPMIGSGLSVWRFHERLGWTAWVGAATIVTCATLLTARHTTQIQTQALVLE